MQVVQRNGEIVYKIARDNSFVFNLLDTISIFFRDIILIITLLFLNAMIYVYFKRTVQRKLALKNEHSNSINNNNNNNNNNTNMSSKLNRRKLLMIVFTSFDLIISRLPTLFIYYRLNGDYVGNSNGCFLTVGYDAFYTCKVIYVFFPYYFNHLIKSKVNSLFMLVLNIFSCRK